MAALEAAASEKKPAPKAKRAGPKISSTDDAKPTAVPDSKDSAILTEWKAADAIRAWARLSPALAEVDLRPYPSRAALKNASSISVVTARLPALSSVN
ncbi:MAG: hypothetical protein IKE66_06590 [Hyphomicrobium sp.]|nr:hypothetical protein [Hyphomicrobium sp.]